MKRQHSFSFIKTMVCLAIAASLILPAGVTTATAKAAEKPSIISEMTIGTGSTYSDYFGYSKNDKYTIEVINPVKKATYSFTSSNKKVVTVKTSGTKAYLTGVKAGTATITCTQKLNGKSTKVGTCKVTVINAKAELELYGPLSMGTGSGYFIYWLYRNNDAKYSYTSNSKDFTIKEVEEKEGDYVSVYQTYTAKKPGKYTITIKESYNKKERTVAKFNIEVVKATVESAAEMYVGDTFWAFDMVRNFRMDCSYLFDFGEDGIVDIYNGEDGITYVKGLKPGTTSVKIYEDTTKADKSKLIGSCKVTVKELKVEDLNVYFTDTATYVGDPYFYVEVYRVPYHAPEGIAISTSDPDIAAIESDGYGTDYFRIVPYAEGTVTITVSCGNITKTETITVYADKDAMYEAE